MDKDRPLLNRLIFLSFNLYLGMDNDRPLHNRLIFLSFNLYLEQLLRTFEVLVFEDFPNSSITLLTRIFDTLNPHV